MRLQVGICDILPGERDGAIRCPIRYLWAALESADVSILLKRREESDPAGGAKVSIQGKEPKWA